MTRGTGNGRLIQRCTENASSVRTKPERIDILIPIDLRICDWDNNVGFCLGNLDVDCEVFSFLFWEAVDGFNLADESVSPFGKGFDKTWMVRRIR